MEITNQIIFFIGLLFFVSILASVVSTRLGVPVLLVFLVLGMLLGEDGPGGIQFDNVQAAHLFASLALAIILFDGGLRTKVATFRVGLRPAILLATLGVAITAAVTAFFAVWIFELTWVQGLLLAAIVSSTDAAAVFSLLHTHGLEIKQRVGATLEIESGSNDPMAIFLTIALIEIIAANQAGPGWFMVNEFCRQMGIGAVFGLAGGWLLGGLINRTLLSGGLYPLLVLSGGLGIYGLAAVVGGSGFLAVYLGALVLGNQPLQASHNIRRFHDGMAWLSQIGMFLMLGLLVTPSDLLPIAWQGLVISGALILLARPLAVYICLLPFHFPWKEQVFIGWVGLRGAVPIILALFPLLAGLENAELYFNVAFFVVLISLLVQGWSVAPLARRFGLEVPSTSEVVQRVELDVPGQAEYEIVGYRLADNSPATAWSASNLPLPRSSRLAGVIRDKAVLHGPELDRFEIGDYVYLIAPPDDLPILDRAFIALPASEPLEERRFFGEFVLDGNARLGDLAQVYGLKVPPDAERETLESYLRKAFSNRAVVGDRVDLSNVQLVVREMEGDRISRVGLKLLPARTRQ